MWSGRGVNGDARGVNGDARGVVGLKPHLHQPVGGPPAAEGAKVSVARPVEPEYALVVVAHQRDAP
eukprot:796571-Pyramimonas_sp.AAC.1